MQDHYVCVHGQFYQPPRGNPWLEDIEQEDSATPYHDWNERVCAECYAPNTASRIVGADKKILDIVNNYSYMSFSMGPSLLDWLFHKQYDIYQKILDADHWSQTRFSGHGSAIAQIYNHVIMPLATSKDKETQVAWGIEDFEFRFGRKPEGMWLAETAVDMETLEILANHGITFTLLAPHQAHQVRKIGEDKWLDVSDGCIDIHLPYLCRLPSGKSIVLFFYDIALSHEIAFSNLLAEGGEVVAKRLCMGFSGISHPSSLVHIAVDGETFGHRHRGGDIPLATCFNYLETNKLAKITIYAEYLEKYPPLYEVCIYDNTSSGCIHGVERWKADCGCTIGNSGWNQAWRQPLRCSLDWLRDILTVLYEKHSAPFLLSDPWHVRDQYILCILDRSTETFENFLSRYAKHGISSLEISTLAKLLEMQRCVLQMYASSGWFFDEVSRNETVQVLKYAARAIQLAEQTTNISLEHSFIKLLERIPSNIVHYKNAGKIYTLLAKNNLVDIPRVSAHYAISSLFRTYSVHEPIGIYTYVIHTENYERLESGKHRLAVGKVQISSSITAEQVTCNFAVLHTGEHNILAKIRISAIPEYFSSMSMEIRESFISKDIQKTIFAMNKHFGNIDYGLVDVFRDEQRRILQVILEPTLKTLEGAFVQIYNHYQPLMQSFRQLQFPLPRPLADTTELILNRELQQLILSESNDFNKIPDILAELHSQSLELDSTSLSFIAQQKIMGMMEKLAHNLHNILIIQKVNSLLEALEPCHLQINLWKAQNIYFTIYRRMMEMSGQYSNLETWLEQFQKLGKYLEVRRR